MNTDIMSIKEDVAPECPLSAQDRPHSEVPWYFRL